MPSTVLYTMGYEGRSLSDLGDMVAQWSIETVIDVRATPHSHKRGFSKPALEHYLSGIGVEYVHAASLGSPKHLRDELLASGDYGAFFAACADHFREKGDSLAEVLSLAQQSRCMLLCFERQADHCHRSVLAKLLCRMDGYQLNIRHI